MTIKAATEQELGELHSKVARVMSDALDVYDKAQTVYLELSPEDLKESGIDPPVVSPPLLAVVTKFLNDNKISCVPEDSKEMSELAERLRAKREGRRAIRTADGKVVGFPQPGGE